MDRVLAVTIALSLAFYIYIWPKDSIFSGFWVYPRAILDLQNHVNPYRTDVQWMFVYHPIVLHAFAKINSFISIIYFLIIFYVLSTVYIAFEIYQLTIQKRFNSLQTPIAKKDLVILILAAAAFGGSGIVSFLTGNLTLYLHFLLVASILTYFRTKASKYGILFITGVMVFSVIKPYFLAYLILIHYLELSKRNKLLLFFGGAIGFLLLWIAPIIDSNMEYQEFLNALHTQILLNDNAGGSFFEIVKIAGASNEWGIVIHVAISLGITICGLIYAPRFFRAVKSPQTPLCSFLLLYFILTLINPRMKIYDLFPGLICFFLWMSQIVKTYTKIMFAGLAGALCPIFFSLFLAFFSAITHPNEPLPRSPFSYFVIGHLLGLLLMVIFVFMDQCRKNVKIHQEKLQIKTQGQHESTVD